MSAFLFLSQFDSLIDWNWNLTLQTISTKLYTEPNGMRVFLYDRLSLSIVETIIRFQRIIDFSIIDIRASHRI